MSLFFPGKLKAKVLMPFPALLSLSLKCFIKGQMAVPIELFCWRLSFTFPLLLMPN